MQQQKMRSYSRHGARDRSSFKTSLTIFFNQDYSPELQKKWVKVHDVIKQLKNKDIQAKCLCPAQLRVKLDTREKTFATLTSVTLLLKELGIELLCGEREHIEEELRERWRSSIKRKRDMVLSTSDL